MTRRTKVWGRNRKKLAKLEPGDSFFLPGVTHRQATNRYYNTGKRLGISLNFHQTDKGVKVTRL